MDVAQKCAAFWDNDMHETKKKSGSFEPLLAALKIETT